MEQITVVCKILRIISNKYKYVFYSVEGLYDLSTLSVNELHGHLLVHEQRMQGNQEDEHVLKVAHEDMTNRERGQYIFQGGRGRGKGRHSLKKAIFECLKCHKPRQF